MFVVIIIICVFNMRQLTSLLLLWLFHLVQCSLCIHVFFSSSSSPIRLIVFLFVMCRHVFFLIICQFFVSPMCENDFSRFFFSPFASSLMHNVILVLKLVHPDLNRIHVKWHVFVYTWKTKCEREKKKYVYMKEWTMNVGHFQQISYSVYLCVCILGWSKFSAVIYLENGF